MSYGVWSTTNGAQAGVEDERRDAGPRSHLVVHAALAALAGRRDVIPLAAELVVGHDDQGPGAAAVLDRLEQVERWSLPCGSLA